ncbi:MAG TPA: histidine--tRNA ligase [Pseudobdellovibrionaceae bacterium]|jgi:histidyl-tRNA synthetase
MSSKFQRVRGTRDLLPEDNIKFRFVESTAHQLSLLYGYGEIETPLFEFSEVFHRTLGETSDVVSKETYTFLDRGGDSITLRPEGTAGVARAFVSEGMAQNLPLKFYYSGPMFRYERPQKGRYRQFKQLGVECLGIDSPLADVECIAMAWDLLGKIGIAGKCHLELNTLGDIESRTEYRKALVDYFSQHQDKLSADSKMRLEKNPLRILDSKDEGDRALIAQAPALHEHLNATSKKFFDDLIKGITALGVPFEINQKLVRGLDYYCHTVFEFVTSELGAQGTVLGGGRYDGLIEMMGGVKTPGVGWAAGVDRLSDLVPAEKYQKHQPLLAIIPADEVGEAACLQVAHKLRLSGLRTELLLSGKMGKRFQKADKIGATHALILGESEVQAHHIAVKDLKSGLQENLSVENLIHKLNK